MLLMLTTISGRRHVRSFAPDIGPKSLSVQPPAHPGFASAASAAAIAMRLRRGALTAVGAAAAWPPSAAL